MTGFGSSISFSRLATFFASTQFSAPVASLCRFLRLPLPPLSHANGQASIFQFLSRSKFGEIEAKID